MRRMTALVVAAAATLTLGLAACGSATPVEDDPAEQANPGSSLTETSYVLKDGRTVICLIHRSDNGRAGLSCDWDHAE